MRRGILCILLLSVYCPFCQSQSVVTTVSYQTPGSIYTQNFDGLPNTGTFTLTGKGPFNLSGAPINGSGLTGWQCQMTGGTNANASFAVGTGSSTGNGLYSLGSVGSTERALGSLASSTGLYAMGIILTNTSGITLNSCTIKFITEQWRRGGSGNKNTWSFKYKTGILSSIDQTGLVNETALDMVSVVIAGSAGSLNGNLPDNQQTVSFTINSIVWKNGEQLLLRWDDADEAGNDDACGIDTFSFTATQVSSVPTAISLAATNITAGSALLNGSVNDHFSNTAVLFEYDTSNIFSSPLTIRAVPDTIYTGTGVSSVSALINGLVTGAGYFFRIKAINAAGSATSATLSFTTSFSLPVVITNVAANLSLSSATLGGKLLSTGGAPILDKGIVWSLSNLPTIANNKMSMGNGDGNFGQPVTALPQGTLIYTRAFATNIAGTAYGNTETFTTQTTVISLVATSASLTNTAIVNFSFKTAQNISGLTASNFAIETKGITGATISSINGSGSNFTIAVNTGTGDGELYLKLVHDTGLSIPIHSKPFLSTDFYTIDKTPPLISSLSIPDKPMKTGDSVSVIILVKPDADIYKMITGKINGFTLTAVTKKNDSLYTSSFKVVNGGNDVNGAASIPVTLMLADSVGNISPSFQSPIIQPSDAIDANNPFITSLITPANGLYKSGDTLDFIFHFSEKIVLTTTAGSSGISVTIGTKSRTIVYAGGSMSDSLIFRYIIQPGDSDKDGIKISSPVNFINTDIKDIAGNMAMLSFNIPSTKNILIDAVIPTITSVTVPVAAIYTTGNVLDFIVNYSKKVLVSSADKWPYITLDIGGAFKNAIYQSGSGSSALLFRYTIQPDDMDKDGIKLLSPANLNAAMIKDEAGNPASLLLNNMGALSSIHINPVTVVVTEVTVPTAGTYKSGDTLIFSVAFNEKVLVTTASGIPSLKLTIGSSSRNAFYQNGSGNNVLEFAYIIQPGEEDTNAIKINAALSMNNGFIKDTRGNNIPPGLHNMGNTSGILIDAVNPSIKAVVVPRKNMYKAFDTLDFTIYFTEKVMVKNSKDTPFIRLEIGSALKKNSYVSGSGTAALLFRYVVQIGDADKNGIKLDSVLTGYNLISDIAGNTAVLALKNIGAVSGIRIDAVAPSFVSDSSQIILCENAAAVSIAELLVVKDEETGESLTWQMVTGSYHGSISKTVFTGTSNGSNITPSSIFYKPDTGYSGTDSLVMQVSDGINTSQKKVIFIIQPSVKNNGIGSSQIICKGNIPAPIVGSLPSGGNGIYTVSWEQSVTDDTTGFGKATSANYLQQYVPGPLSTTTWFRRKLTSGACFDISTATKITVLKNGVWTGNFDQNWHNENNWCTAMIPDTVTDVFINGNTKYNPLIKDTGKCNNLTLLNNARLGVTGSLQLKESIVNTSGFVDANKGSLLCTGLSMQIIPAGFLIDNNLQNLVINNPAGVSLAGPIKISGSLIVNSGTLVTNDQLSLLHTASIGASAAGTTIRGNIFIKHFIPSGRRAFRLLGHPFSDTIALDMIKDSIDITGNGGTTNGFTSTATNQPSAFRYDPLLGNDSSGIDAGWIPFTHTNGQSENAWKEFAGIRLFARGKPEQGLDGTPAGDGTNGTYFPKEVLLSLSGKVHTGDQEIILSKNTLGNYHIIANPYPAAVELSMVTRGEDIGMNYWLWDPLQATMGGYSSIPFTSKNILPPFGAFIVKANGNNHNSLLFTENCKVTERGTGHIPLVNNDDSYFIELRLETDSIFWDRILLLAIDSAKTNVDKIDAEKFRNSDVNFYSISRDQKMLSIDARPINNESKIALGLQTNSPKQFNLRVAKISLPVTNTLLLHDRHLDRWIKLEKDSSYPFVTTTDTATMGNERFEIISRKKKMTDTIPPFTITASIMPVPATDKIMVNYVSSEKGNTTIRIIGLNGTPVKRLELGMQKEGKIMIPVSDIPNGMYLLELRCGENIATKKIIKQ